MPSLYKLQSTTHPSRCISPMCSACTMPMYLPGSYRSALEMVPAAHSLHAVATATAFTLSVCAWPNLMV